MKTIKTYEDFVNEEINWKKALATGALATGMAMSNPSYSQTINKQDSILPSRVDKKPLEFKEIYKIDQDTIGKYSFYNGVWKKGIVDYKKDESSVIGINSELTIYDINSALLKINNVSFFSIRNSNININSVTSGGVFITSIDEYEKLKSNIYKYNEQFEITFVEPRRVLSNLNLYLNEIIDNIKSPNEKKSIDNTKKLVVKSGYIDGRKVVRFVMVDYDDQFDIDKAYMECDFDEFIKLITISN